MYDSNVKGTCTAKTLNNNNNNNNNNTTQHNTTQHNTTHTQHTQQHTTTHNNTQQHTTTTTTQKNKKQQSHLHYTSSRTLNHPILTPSTPPRIWGWRAPLRITQGCPAMLLRRFDAQHGVVRHRGAEEPARPRRSQEAAVPDAHLTDDDGWWVISGWGDLLLKGFFFGGGKCGGWWWSGDVKGEGGCVWVNWDLIM